MLWVGFLIIFALIVNMDSPGVSWSAGYGIRLGGWSKDIEPHLYRYCNLIAIEFSKTSRLENGNETYSHLIMVPVALSSSSVSIKSVGT